MQSSFSLSSLMSLSSICEVSFFGRGNIATSIVIRRYCSIGFLGIQLVFMRVVETLYWCIISLISGEEFRMNFGILM